MKKIIIVTVLILLFFSCSTIKPYKVFSLRDEINNTIVFDFYENDTIGKNVYLLE